VEYFDYGEPQAFNNSSDFDVERFLEKSEQREQELLEEELERINDLLEERRSIHEEAVTDLESKLDWYIERLEDLYRRGLDKNKDELKQRIKEFYRELREQKRKHWLDRQELEQEQREMEKELQESDIDELLEFL